MRSCTISMMFTSRSASCASSVARPPGVSGIRTRKDRYRPAAAMPCRITRISSNGSMLPPDSTTTTGGLNRRGSSSTAATAAAPAGSTTSFARSRTSKRALDNESSPTVRTSPTYRWTASNGTVPGSPTAIPSAIVAM